MVLNVLFYMFGLPKW